MTMSVDNPLSVCLSVCLSVVNTDVYLALDRGRRRSGHAVRHDPTRLFVSSYRDDPVSCFVVRIRMLT